jgi:hypothetical protein
MSGTGTRLRPPHKIYTKPSRCAVADAICTPDGRSVSGGGLYWPPRPTWSTLPLCALVYVCTHLCVCMQFCVRACTCVCVHSTQHIPSLPSFNRRQLMSVATWTPGRCLVRWAKRRSSCWQARWGTAVTNTTSDTTSNTTTTTTATHPLWVMNCHQHKGMHAVVDVHTWPSMSMCVRIRPCMPIHVHMCRMCPNMSTYVHMPTGA